MGWATKKAEEWIYQAEETGWGLERAERKEKKGWTLRAGEGVEAG